MTRQKDPSKSEFDDSVSRLVGAVGRGIADTVERRVDRARDRREAELAAKAERERRRRAAKYENRTRVEGWALAAVGIVLFVMGLVVRQEQWWLVFPGFFIGMRGARILGHKAQKRKAQQPPPMPQDPREVRLVHTCEGLLNALHDASDQMKAFLGHPEKTVATLQASAKDLLRRERQLRALVNPGEEGRLASERDRLLLRAQSATDRVARERFEAALAALDQQISQRREVARNADRLEAEHTRLMATLEGLHINVVRLATSDAVNADVAGAGLRQSLDALKSEIDALADAAEQTHRIEDFATGPDPFATPETGHQPREKL